MSEYFYCSRLDSALSTDACRANRKRPAFSSSLRSAELIATTGKLPPRPCECNDCPLAKDVDKGKIKTVPLDRFEEVSALVGTNRKPYTGSRQVNYNFNAGSGLAVSTG